MRFVTDRHNADRLGEVVHFIKDPIFPDAQLPRGNWIVPQQLTVLGFKQWLIRELLANLRHDEFPVKGSIVRKVRLRLFCDFDPIGCHAKRASKPVVVTNDLTCSRSLSESKLLASSVSRFYESRKVSVRFSLLRYPGHASTSSLTSILPVTAAEISAVRYSFRLSIPSQTLARSPSIFAVSRSRKAPMASCWVLPGTGISARLRSRMLISLDRCAKGARL